MTEHLLYVFPSCSFLILSNLMMELWLLFPHQTIRWRLLQMRRHPKAAEPGRSWVGTLGQTPLTTNVKIITLYHLRATSSGLGFLCVWLSCHRAGGEIRCKAIGILWSTSHTVNCDITIYIITTLLIRNHKREPERRSWHLLSKE